MVKPICARRVEESNTQRDFHYYLRCPWCLPRGLCSDHGDSHRGVVDLRCEASYFACTPLPRLWAVSDSVGYFFSFLWAVFQKDFPAKAERRLTKHFIFQSVQILADSLRDEDDGWNANFRKVDSDDSTFWIRTWLPLTGAPEHINDGFFTAWIRSNQTRSLVTTPKALSFYVKSVDFDETGGGFCAILSWRPVQRFSRDGEIFAQRKTQWLHTNE